MSIRLSRKTMLGFACLASSEEPFDFLPEDFTLSNDQFNNLVKNCANAPYAAVTNLIIQVQPVSDDVENVVTADATPQNTKKTEQQNEN
jgi:hypothetical protein